MVGRDIERLLRDGVLPAERDACLLERYLADRDELAFEAIVDRHGPLVLSLRRRYLRDPHDVEDAFQATFLILARKGRSLRDRASLSSWLYGVAHRVALRARADVLKRREREGGSGLALEPAAPATEPPDDSIEALDHELSRLPEKYRAPLVLCYLKGRTHDQAAGELGWPVGTVRSRMSKARAILRKRLSRRGLDATASLAIPRLELLSSSSVSTVPDSLIQATLSAANRYLGATALTGAAASLSSTSSSWPATALAQGVLATMMLSQLKSVGLGIAFGLIAGALGAGALAVNASDGPEAPARPVVKAQAADADPSIKPPSPENGKAPGPPQSDVEIRLQELERQLARILQRSSGRSSSDEPLEAPAPPSMKPAEVTAESDFGPPGGIPTEPGASPYSPRLENTAPHAASPLSYNALGPREIEARLVNVHLRYKRAEESLNEGMASEEERKRALESARILVARLKGMREEADAGLEEYSYADAANGKAREEYLDAQMKFEAAMNRASGDPQKAQDP